MLFTIEVNNKQIFAKKGETVLECLNRNGLNVPTLCHMNGFSPTGACRICVVEVEGKNNLIPSCSYPVEEWMKISTHSPRVIKARQQIVELLLSNHPDECLYCERNGNCELQDLAIDLNIRERRFSGKKNMHKKDHASPSIIRDPAKCILCGRCVRVCDEVISVSAIDFIRRGNRMAIGTAYNKGLNLSTCVDCGQCIMVCPTGALYEKPHINKVMDALHQPSQQVYVHYSPSISVSIAEEFGFRSGKDISGILIAALRKIGFKKVFVTGFAADIAVHEIASNMHERLKSGDKSPVFSSCCPGWIKFAEEFYPEILSSVSTVKSPQQIMGQIIKGVYAKSQKIHPENIFTVSVMPCTAKKFEAQREEMTVRGITHTDAVITTRELVNMIKLYGIDLTNIEPELADSPFNIRSSAAKLYAVSGGVAEAVVRTLNYLVSGNELDNLKISELRSTASRREYRVKMSRYQVGFAVVNGLIEVRKIIQEIKNGRSDIQFIEVMSCEGGCIYGGGQPIGLSEKDVRARAKAIYELDDKETIRVSHKNPGVQEWLTKIKNEETGGLSSLHTTYSKRDILL